MQMKRWWRYMVIVMRRKTMYFCFKYKVRFSGGMLFLMRLIRLGVRRRLLYMHLRFLKRVKPIYRNRIIRDIYKMIKDSKDPDLVDRNAHIFALSSIDKDKWYHKSADMWILYNSLPLADTKLVKRVLEYLKRQQKRYIP